MYDLLTGNRIIGNVFAFICLCLLSTLPRPFTETPETGSIGSIEERRPFPLRPVTQVALLAIFFASCLEFTAILWQHTASVATITVATTIWHGTVGSKVGVAAMVIGWIAVPLLVIATWQLLVFILSLQMMARLTDDE